MNADFSFGKLQWKKLIALVLCMALALPTLPVFGATDGGAGTLTKQEITADAKAAQIYATLIYRNAYTGKAVKPKVKVSDIRTGKKISSKNYTVTYGVFNSKGKFVKKTPKEIGAYAVKITFKGAYKKHPVIYSDFEIVPKKAAVSSVSGKKKTMTVKWKKAGKSQATYYEIAYSTNKNFGNEKVVSSKKGASSATIKLKKNTTYYVKIRAVKEIKITSSYTRRFVGDWSTAKKVTVKK